MEITTEGFNYNDSGYGYLTHKWIKLDSDGKGKNERVSVMNSIEVAALEGAQIRLVCIEGVTVCWLC